jgi:hypothetical protein
VTATLSTREVIEHGIKSVAAALNQRKPSAATIDVWSDLFADENPRLLAACFRRLAEESEKFPTVRRMRGLLAECRPSSNPALTYTEGFDANGVPCWFWSDEPTVPAYSAADCEEARERLAKLRELCAPKRLPGSKEKEARRAELQRQKVQILRMREPGEEG